MLPMTEPVTEIALEAPAGLIRIRATCAGGKVTGRRRSATCRRSRPTSTRRSRSPSSARSTVDVAYGGMFYVIADAEALGFRLTPDEGRDITRVTEMIKAAAREQLPVVHPEQPGFAGITIGQLSGPAARPAELAPERGDGLDRRARLGRSRRPGPGVDRPLAVRHRDVRQDGRPARARASCGRGDEFRHEGILGTVFTGRRRGGDAGRRPAGDRARRSPGPPGSPGSRATSSTRPTRSRRATRSATSGSGPRTGSAQQVAPAERDLGDRVDGERAPVQRDGPRADVDVDRGGRAVGVEGRARQAAHAADRARGSVASPAVARAPRDRRRSRRTSPRPWAPPTATPPQSAR